MSETSITFKCTEDLKAILGRQAIELDLNASELIRACIVLALPQIKFVNGLDRIKDKDMRSAFSDNK